MSNKISYFRFLAAPFTLVLVCTILTGCEQFPGDEDFYEISVAPEKLRQVETLELQETEVQENNFIDMNEPPPKELSLNLEECRAITLENNLELKVQLISPAIAAERVSEEEAVFESALTSNLVYSIGDTPTVTTLDAISGSNVKSTYSDLGVQIPLQTGGTIRFDTVDNRIDTDAPTSFNPFYSSDLGVSISQHLLRGAFY